MNETKKPAVRFKGFSDEWEQQKFNDILEKYEDPVATPHDGYERLGVRSHAKGTFHSYVAPGAELETAQMHRVAANKMLFNITFAWEHAVAITDEMDAGKLVSHRFPQFSFNPEMSPKFFKYVISNEKFRYHLWLSSPGGAGRNRVLNIPEMLKYQTYLPEKSEQDLLADWFIHLDELIEQHQSKLEKLQSLKASMLEKMFPKDGADVPDIRFKGFTKAWIKRKIGECFVERNESFPDGELLSVTINNGVRKFSELDRRDTSNSDKSKYKKVCVGDIAYNSMRMWQGASGYSPYEGIVSPAYTVLSPNPGINSKCIAYYFKSDEIVQTFQKNSQGITSDNWNLKFPALSKIEIRISPNMEEQKKIAAYFSQLDALIYQFEQELAKLQSIKKALLEKMFV